jgi:glutaredoxin-like YruB-family protein
MIKIYSTPYCSVCEALKSWLKENNQEFESIDVSENEEARNEMIEKTNQMTVPVSVVDDEVIVGFDLNKFKEKLSK